MSGTDRTTCKSGIYQLECHCTSVKLVLNSQTNDIELAWKNVMLTEWPLLDTQSMSNRPLSSLRVLVVTGHHELASSGSNGLEHVNL